MRSYQDFPTLPWNSKETKENCQNITTPCWIPHAANMIGSISNKLPICDTFKKYTCMLATIKSAKYATQEQCRKSCKDEIYSVWTSGADIEPFTKVRKGIIREKTELDFITF